jgi:hypothetical protein
MTPKKNDHFLQIGITIFLACSCLFISCSAPEKRLTKDQLTISYASQISLDREIKKLLLDHPVKISAEQVANHLFSFQYKQAGFLGKKKHVFSPNDVLEITPVITKALNRMTPYKVLRYAVETPRGKTAGIIFRAEEKINWRFETINGSHFLNTGLHNGGSPWVLFPKNGQKFHKERSLFGSEWEGNWIISNLELPIKSKRGRKLGLLKKTSKPSSHKRSRKKETARRTNSKEGGFEKRLQFLKGLRDKKLINNEEYTHKKKELLEQFP